MGATIGFVSSVVSDLLSGEEVDWWGAAISAGIGAVEGGLTAACPAYAVVISATASAADTAINSTRNYVNKGEGSVGGIVAKTVVSAGIGALSGNGDDLVKHFKSYGAGASRRIGRVIVRGYKSVLTEGTSAVRGGLTAIAKEIAGSGKYYFSQTKFFYKKNFWKSDLLSFLDDTLNGTIDNYLTREIA